MKSKKSEHDPNIFSAICSEGFGFNAGAEAVAISGPWIPKLDSADLLDIVVRRILAQSNAKLPTVQPAAFDGLVITSETDVTAGNVEMSDFTYKCTASFT